MNIANKKQSDRSIVGLTRGDSLDKKHPPPTMPPHSLSAGRKVLLLASSSVVALLILLQLTIISSSLQLTTIRREPGAELVYNCSSSSSPQHDDSVASLPDESSIHVSASTTAPRTSSITTITCYVPPRISNWQGHFPHHMENIVKCWHALYEEWYQHQTDHPVETNQLDKYINVHDRQNQSCVYLQGRIPSSSYGNQILSQVLQCRRMVDKSRSPAILQSANNNSTGEERQKVVVLTGGVPAELDITWFHSVAEASAFRQQLLPDQASPFADTNANVNNRTIRIGFIQRRNSRRLLNLETILGATQNRSPLITMNENNKEATSWHIETSVAYLEDLPQEDQARFFASHHMVITPHGAGTINAAFLFPGAVVLEIFPPMYAYIFYFQRLVEQAGGHYLFWYTGQTTPPTTGNDTSQNTTTASNRRLPSDNIAQWKKDFERYKAQFQTIKQGSMEPPVSEIMALIDQGIQHVLDGYEISYK